jgi:hypothetical protein
MGTFTFSSQREREVKRICLIWETIKNLHLKRDPDFNLMGEGNFMIFQSNPKKKKKV